MHKNILGGAILDTDVDILLIMIFNYIYLTASSSQLYTGLFAPSSSVSLWKLWPKH